MKATLQWLASALAGPRVLPTLLAIAFGAAPETTIPGSGMTAVSGAPVAAGSERVRLVGHRPSLAGSVPSSRQLPPALDITLTLRRDDESGFARYLSEVYDAKSPSFHRFLTPTQVSDRFGPSAPVYEAVRAWLRTQNLELVADSPNRMTMTVRGNLADVERAFSVDIGNYTRDQSDFYSNAHDPALPADLADHVRSVSGLSSLATPRRIGALDQISRYGGGGGAAPDDETLALTCELAEKLDHTEQAVTIDTGLGLEGLGGLDFSLSFVQTFLNYQCAADELNLVAAYAANAGSASPPAPRPPWSIAVAASTAPGAGQKVGLVEFATYQTSDVQDWLDLVGHPERLANVSKVVVSSGASQNINDESEALLDIDTILMLAPGAGVVVYQGGFAGAGSFQGMFNAMINGGVNVIANSWAYCENQTTLADVQGVEDILLTAAASGITVLTGAGDSGSTCLDGSPNTIAVPADAPHITAVGGTSATNGVLGTYGSETWWDGSAHTPPTGQGGFGLSQFFATPGYQNALNVQTHRSVPDVVSPADPRRGVFLCQADNGGCPNLLLYGGTSYAAPTWAAFVAVLNQRTGTHVGFLNDQIYPLANGSAFHNAAALGSDFAHVGLGSPNVAELQRHLQNQSIGAVSTAASTVVAYPETLVADGATKAGVVAVLFDANFHSVSGTAVTLAANVGSHAVIAAVSGTTSDASGVVRYTVSDNVPETVTLTATVGAGQIAQTAQITFVGPPAAFASIGASPASVPADGTSTSTITITLEDAAHNPAPNKQVTIAQGAGHASIVGPTPSLTDSNGQLTFAAADTFTETVTFTAIDVTDGDLPIPGSAPVSFTSGTGSNCNLGTEIPAAGYQITSVVTGFKPDSGNCVGASGIAWDPQGNMYAINYGYNGGDLYRFPAGSLPSVASAGTRLTSTQYATGTCTHGLAFSKDGTHLYLARQFCGSGGDVVEISTADGHIIRNVAPAGSIPCATGIAVDPLSGDLFVATPCGPPDIFRIGNPDSATPAAPVVYSASGAAIGLNFTPDGTIWTEGYGAGQVIKISGTNSGSPGTSTPLASAPTHAGGVLPEFNPANPASPAALFVSDGVAALSAAGSVELVDLTQNPAVIHPVASGGVGQLFVVAGPDGCAYVSNADRIDRISKDDGSCDFAPSNAGVRVVLSPNAVAPNPLQGTAQDFSAQLVNVSSPAGQGVDFTVAGANNLVQHVDAAADGSAPFSYTAAHAGSDTVRASTTVNGVKFVSNFVAVTWDAGKHMTGLTLNQNAGAAGSGAVAASATLLDLSVTPFAPISGATVQFALAGLGCSDVTDANGTAGCPLSPTLLSTCTLTASYAGDGTRLPSTASTAFAPSADVIFFSGFQVPAAGCH